MAVTLSETSSWTVPSSCRRYAVLNFLEYFAITVCSSNSLVFFFRPANSIRRRSSSAEDSNFRIVAVRSYASSVRQEKTRYSIFDCIGRGTWRAPSAMIFSTYSSGGDKDCCPVSLLDQPSNPSSTKTVGVRRDIRSDADVRGYSLRHATCSFSSHAWNINTFHKWNCQFLCPPRCCDHFWRIGSGLKKPSRRSRPSFNNASAQSRKGPRNHESIGTPNPILGLSISAFGTCLLSTSRKIHLPCPFRILMDSGKRHANSTTRWSRNGTRVSRLTPIAARSTFTRMSSGK
jgi:hypothetical protein